MMEVWNFEDFFFATITLNFEFQRIKFEILRIQFEFQRLFFFCQFKELILHFKAHELNLKDFFKR